MKSIVTLLAASTVLLSFAVHAIGGVACFANPRLEVQERRET